MATKTCNSAVEGVEDALVGREYWLTVAREAFVEGGVENVKVDRLARMLNVTRGGFYWHFKNREDLLQALLASWQQTNTKPMFDAVKALPKGDGAGKFIAISRVWIEEQGFSSAYDAAIRDWARTSPEVAVIVREVDDRRIKLVQGIFEEDGLCSADALTRAQILYFHQVGYYAMGVRESCGDRLRNISRYYKVFTGKDIPEVR